MKTSIDVQLEYSGQWLPGELMLGSDGSPVVVVAGEIEERGPADVFYIRSDSETDRILPEIAAEAGFNVIEG